LALANRLAALKAIPAGFGEKLSGTAGWLQHKRTVSIKNMKRRSCLNEN